MQIDVKKAGIIVLFFLLGLTLIWLGATGRFGLMLGAIFTPEYLTVTPPSTSGSGSGSGSGGGGNGG